MNAPAGIKMVILDVDGVLSDGTIILDEDGRESKGFSSRDGLGIYLLKRAGIDVAVISGRATRVVEHRARALDIKEVHQGIGDKLEVYQSVIASHGLQDAEVCYVGDDLIDLPVMKRVGFAAAPADAHPVVLEAAHWVAPSNGGRGAVREVIEEVLRAGGQWETVLKEFDR